MVTTVGVKLLAVVVAAMALGSSTVAFQPISLKRNSGISSQRASLGQKQAPLIESLRLFHRTNGSPTSLWTTALEVAEVPPSEKSELTIELRSAVQVAEVPPSDNSELMIKLRKYAATFCNFFPVWTVITASIALTRPKTFLSIPPTTFPAQIGMLMLCMGITLKPSDFKRVLQRPAAVLLAFFGCYGVVRVFSNATIAAASWDFRQLSNLKKLFVSSLCNRCLV